MFDYKLLAALAAVVEQGGFERAAQLLGLSQSAVSQRIKLLEARVGQPVLVRATPPTPTEVGTRLLNHVQQVRLLERDLQRQVPALEEDGIPERLRIALNADSLATWWAASVAGFCAEQRVLMELVVEDQEAVVDWSLPLKMVVVVAVEAVGHHGMMVDCSHIDVGVAGSLDRMKSVDRMND